ncbi:MAG: hypothetical protein WBB89_01560 [Candidatus Acidiferrum sp.]
MNRRISMSPILGAALFLSAGVARAQEPPPHPGGDVMFHRVGPRDDFMAPPMGERIELLGFEGMHGGKVVTGAPFSAVAISETSRTLADGNHISRKTQTNLFRDSQGRFRKEVTLPAIGPLATSAGPRSFVMINDPVAQQNFILHPEEKTAEKMGKAFGRMKGGTPGERHGGWKGNAESWEAKAAASGNFKKEDLGTQTIAGVSAQGTRYTRIIPAGQIGNEKPITIVSEHWYSNDLQMTVMSKRSDPQFGETTYTLTNIQRAEPAASLFAVPSDYTLQEGHMGRHMMKYKQGASPPEN